MWKQHGFGLTRVKGQNGEHVVCAKLVRTLVATFRYPTGLDARRVRVHDSSNSLYIHKKVGQ